MSSQKRAIVVFEVNPELNEQERIVAEYNFFIWLEHIEYPSIHILRVNNERQAKEETSSGVENGK